MDQFTHYTQWERDFEEPPEAPECPKCKEHEELLDDAKMFLSAIVHQLYSNEQLDPLELENDLDELCHLLDVKLIPGDLTIQRKKGVL